MIIIKFIVGIILSALSIICLIIGCIGLCDPDSDVIDREAVEIIKIAVIALVALVGLFIGLMTQ